MQKRGRVVTAWVRTWRGGAVLGATLMALVVAIAFTTSGAGPGPAAAETESEPAASAPEAAPLEGTALNGEPGVVPVIGPGPTPIEVVPVPPGERVAKPAHVRGIYLNAWAAGSPRKRARLIDLAQRTEVNSFVIDVKEVGEISYPSAVPLAVEIGATRAYIPNIRRVLDEMRANGIYPIARIVVFRDEVLAKARPDLAVQYADGSPWHDHHGHYWVDSFNRDVWDYNIAIAREAIELGFSEVQWDYVRFPDVPPAVMQTAVWPAHAGRTKADAIREFLLYSRAQLADLDVPVTADVFGLTVSTRGDMGIGQQWEKMIDAVDVILPMVYPSHYARGSYGIAYPNSRPYGLIKATLGFAVRRSSNVAGAAVIRPWLQDFTLGSPRYGPEHVRAQIRAVYEAGLTEWVLWNPGSNYTEGALANSSGLVPDLPIPDTDLLPVPAPRDTGPRLLGEPARGEPEGR